MLPDLATYCCLLVRGSGNQLVQLVDRFDADSHAAKQLCRVLTAEHALLDTGTTVLHRARSIAATLLQAANNPPDFLG
ncbi:hypothetical protein D3C77_169440 [compost metagenome]